MQGEGEARARERTRHSTESGQHDSGASHGPSVARQSFLPLGESSLVHLLSAAPSPRTPAGTKRRHGRGVCTCRSAGPERRNKRRGHFELTLTLQSSRLCVNRRIFEAAARQYCLYIAALPRSKMQLRRTELGIEALPCPGCALAFSSSCHWYRATGTVIGTAVARGPCIIIGLHLRPSAW
jgi:hypothetical protein